MERNFENNLSHQDTNDDNHANERRYARQQSSAVAYPAVVCQDQIQEDFLEGSDEAEDDMDMTQNDAYLESVMDYMTDTNNRNASSILDSGEPAVS